MTSLDAPRTMVLKTSEYYMQLSSTISPGEQKKWKQEITLAESQWLEHPCAMDIISSQHVCNVPLHLDPGKLLGPSDPALRAPLEAPLRACSLDQYPEFLRSALVYILVPLCSWHIIFVYRCIHCSPLSPLSSLPSLSLLSHCSYLLLFVATIYSLLY